jgi:hypothetical protein
VTRTSLLVGLLLGLVVAGATAGIVLAFRGGDDAELTRAEYVASATAICESYGKRLDRVPPPLDPASPGAVYESIGLALPILHEQSAKVRALVPPPAVRTSVRRFFALTERALAHLERARRHAGRRELFPMVQALTAFGTARDAAKRVSRSIGFKC